MTEHDFRVFDSRILSVSYLALIVAVVFLADFINLSIANDLTPWGSAVAPIIIIAGLAVFGLLQALRAVAYIRRYANND